MIVTGVAARERVAHARMSARFRALVSTEFGGAALGAGAGVCGERTQRTLGRTVAPSTCFNVTSTCPCTRDPLRLDPTHPDTSSPTHLNQRSSR